MEEITLESLSASTRDEWNAYVDGHAQATAYHRAEVKSLVMDVFGHDSQYLIARSNKNIVGVLPVVKQSSFLFGKRLLSLPYFNYGGVLADSDEVADFLLAAMSGYARGQGIGSIEYRETQQRADYPSRTDKVAMYLELPESPEALASQIGSKRRSQIKRPQRENPRVATGGKELLNDFYSVFSENMRDLGTPVYSKKFFSGMLDTFPDESKLIVIYMAEQPVSCAYVLGYKSRAEIPWASTLRRVNNLSVNMLLYWEVLSYVINAGYKQFDFGRSTVDSGTYHFKRRWGAQPVQLYWNYWLDEGVEPPDIKPDNPKFRLLISTWKKLPLSLSNLLGPLVAKDLP